MSICKACLRLIFLFSLTSGFAQLNSESLGNPDAIVLDLDIDEDKNLLVALTNTEIQLWNYQSKTLIRQWAAPSVHSIELHHRSLAGISKSGELYIWDIESGKESRYVIGASPLLSLVWIDSTWIAAGGEDGILYKVHAKTGEISKSTKLNASVTALSRYTNNTLLVGKRKRGIEVYDALSLTPIQSIKESEGAINFIHFADSAENFITVSDEKQVTKWRVSDLKKSVNKYHGTWITAIDFIDSKDNSIIAVGKLNGDIIVNIGIGSYSGVANAIVNELVVIEDELPSIKLIVATHGAGIQLWDARKMKLKTH